MFVAGIDEVGWGACAGPLVLGLVVMPATFQDPRVKDSKEYHDDGKRKSNRKTAHQKRRDVLGVIYQAACWVDVYTVPHFLLDQDPGRVKRAVIGNMIRDIWDRFHDPRIQIVVDGADEGYPAGGVPYVAIPKADARVTACSAASVVAKVRRDDFMIEMGQLDLYRPYRFEVNKGYQSEEHRDAILRHGASDLHRPLWLRNLHVKHQAARSAR